jgi:hypothetical protein
LARFITHFATGKTSRKVRHPPYAGAVSRERVRGRLLLDRRRPVSPRDFGLDSGGGGDARQDRCAAPAALDFAACLGWTVHLTVPGGRAGARQATWCGAMLLAPRALFMLDCAHERRAHAPTCRPLPWHPCHGLRVRQCSTDVGACLPRGELTLCCPCPGTVHHDRCMAGGRLPMKRGLPHASTAFASSFLPVSLRRTPVQVCAAARSSAVYPCAVHASFASIPPFNFNVVALPLRSRVAYP